MSRLGAAVTVVTTGGAHGKVGFTATAVCSVSDDPPTLLVCVHRMSRAGQILRRNDVLCVNVLRAGENAIADVFAGRTGTWGVERFSTGDWLTLETGAPVLASALVSIECRLIEVKAVATHDIFFAAVQGIRHGLAGPALIYYGRVYAAADAVPTM